MISSGIPGAMDSAFCENIARNVMKNGRKTSQGVDLH